MKADAATRAEIVETIKGMWKAYGRRDVEGVLAFYAPDADVTVIGSGRDEIYAGPGQARKGLKRDFTQSENAKVKLAKMRVSVAGKVAWLAADCLFTAKTVGDEVSMAGILTAVFEKRKGRWLIMQSHFAMPYEGQAEGESFPGAKGDG